MRLNTMSGRMVECEKLFWVPILKHCLITKSNHRRSNSSPKVIQFSKRTALRYKLSPPATDEDLSFTRPSTGYECGYHTTKANPNGVACRLEGSSTSCLFMGDLENDDAHNAESWLCKQHDAGELNLNADVLFCGHHGSHNATSEALLDRVDPETVVISSGLDNKHNPPDNQYNAHPRDETLERLHERDIDVYWTAGHGTVSLTDDGELGIIHDNAVETTNAGDIAALKYYGRENDLDQEALVEIEAIEFSDLPEEMPDWVRETSLVTKQSAIDPEKIDELHVLEVEHGSLKQKKHRLERTREQRLEQKAALEQESENKKK